VFSRTEEASGVTFQINQVVANELNSLADASIRMQLLANGPESNSMSCIAMADGPESLKWREHFCYSPHILNNFINQHHPFRNVGKREEGGKQQSSFNC
jgi:hypothetical protein